MAHQTVFSVTCINNSDSEILAALQTVGSVVRTQRHRLDADRFSMLSGDWTWQGFVAIWIAIDLGSGLSP